MTIDLEPEATSSAFASVRMDKVGDTFVGMLIGYDGKAPLFEYQTAGSTTPRRRALDINGKEKTQDVLTVLLLDKTTCQVRMPRQPGQDRGEDATGREAVGSVARIWIKGHNRWTKDRPDSFREAKSAHGNFQVGDVIRGELTEVVDVGASQPKKVISFGMRKPRPDEQALVQRCVDEYHQLNGVDLESTPEPVTGHDVEDDGGW